MAKANEIIRLVEERGVKLQCSYPRRWTPRYQAVRRLIQEGAIGDVLSVAGMGFDSLIHNGTHATDAMTYVAADPEPSLAVGRVEPEVLNQHGRPIQDGRGSGYVEHTNGVRFYIDGLSVAGPQAFVIAGTAGRIVAVNDCRHVDLWRRPPGAAQRDLRPVDQQLAGLVLVAAGEPSARREGHVELRAEQGPHLGLERRIRGCRDLRDGDRARLDDAQGELDGVGGRDRRAGADRAAGRQLGGVGLVGRDGRGVTQQGEEGRAGRTGSA